MERRKEEVLTAGSGPSYSSSVHGHRLCWVRAPHVYICIVSWARGCGSSRRTIEERSARLHAAVLPAGVTLFKIPLPTHRKMLEKKKAEFDGERVIAEFEELTRDAAAVQRETLQRILAENAGVEYLQELGLDGRTDPDSFRA